MRKDPKERKLEILEVAMKIAQKHHYSLITPYEVARVLGIVPGTILHYFKTTRRFRNAILREGIKRHNYAIIAQGMQPKTTAVAKAPPDVLRATIDYLGGEYGLRN